MSQVKLIINNPTLKIKNRPDQLISRILLPGSRYQKPGQRSFIWDVRCRTPHATYPKTWADSPQTFPYLVLHRTGFTKLFQSPGKLVRSYRTVSPLPGLPFFALGNPGGLLSVALSFTSP